MSEQQLQPIDWAHWATTLRHCGLADLAIPFLDLLQVWGFVGSQMLWMLTPFWDTPALPALAETLEQPEILRDFQRRLLEGEGST